MCHKRMACHMSVTGFDGHNGVDSEVKVCDGRKGVESKLKACEMSVTGF